MSDWAVGLSTGCFCGTSIFECLEEIRNAGFGRIEICSGRGHLDYHNTEQVHRAAEQIDRLGLESYSFHAPFANSIDITSPDPNARAMALEELTRAAEGAAILRVRYFVIHPGPETSTLPDHERFARMENAVGVLNQAYVRCRGLRIGLVLENMLPHLFAGRVRDLLWVLGALDTTGVGICLDTGHAHLGEEVSKVVHKLSGHLWMMHASDNHGQYDDHLPPGDGKIEWAKLLAHLNRLHFSGTIILENKSMGNPRATLEAACRGRKHLRDLSHRLRIWLERGGKEVNMSVLSRRVMRAMKLNRQLYEEVERDPSAMGQALAVVALSSVATVVGMTGRLTFADLPPALVLGIVAWSGWSAIAFLVGAQVCPEPETRSDWGELLRTTGFATAPGLLSFLGIFPAFTGLIAFVASVWMLLAFGVAVRQALDYRGLFRAVAVCAIGWALYAGMLFSFMPRT